MLDLKKSEIKKLEINLQLQTNYPGNTGYLASYYICRSYFF